MSTQRPDSLQLDAGPEKVGVSRVLALACAALLNVTLANADSRNDVIGFSPNHVFENVLAGENVDLLSGNVNLEIPIGPNFKVADNLDYRLTLYYNSKVWEHLCPESLPVGEYCHGQFALPSEWGLGFNLGFGRIHRVEERLYSGFVVEPPDRSGVYRYQTPDGADHHFCSGIACTEKEIVNGNGGQVFTPGITLDGSGIRVTGNETSGWIVYPGDGTRIIFDHEAASTQPRDSGWYATRIETILTKTTGPQAGESVGWIDIAYTTSTSTRLSQISDSTGRVVTVSPWVDAGILQHPDRRECTVSVPSTNGLVNYVLRSDKLLIEDPVDLTSSGSPTPISVPAYFLERITFPDVPGPEISYQFEYTDAGTANPYGYMTKRILPTGAAVSYDYGHYSAGDKRPLRVEMRYKTLTLPPGTPGGSSFRWSYSRFGDGVIRTRAELNSTPRDGYIGGFRLSNAAFAYVLDPFNNLTVHQFHYTGSPTTDTVPNSSWNDGMLEAVRVYAGPEFDGSRLVQETKYEYTHEGSFQNKSMAEDDYCPDIANQWQCDPPYQSIPVNSRRSSETVKVPATTSSPEKNTRVEYSDWPSISDVTWAQLSGARKADTYDGGQLVRTTYTDLAPTKEWHGTHRFVETRNAVGVVTSRTERQFNFDRIECEVQRANPSTPMASGALDCDAAITAGDVKSRFAYDPSTGQRISITVSGGDDGGSTVTKEERDVAGNLLRRWFDGLSWDAQNRTIDLETGLVSESRATDGGKTEYDWDALGRLTSIKPEGSETRTTIAYPSLFKTIVTRDGGANHLLQTTYLYDKLGRNIEVQRMNATGGKDFQRMRHDILGRVLRRSEWATFVSDPEVEDSDLSWTEYDFTIAQNLNGATGLMDRYPDPLGRVHKVTAPDGATTVTEYLGNDSLVRTDDIQGPDGPIQSLTRFTRDGLDRLVTVDAPGGGADAKYSYDDQDRMLAVELTDPIEATRKQYRSFAYDALGRLRQSMNPETGTLSEMKYDARGNLLEFKDAHGSKFTNTYDVAGRLLSRSVKDGMLTLPLVLNYYDASSVCSGGSSAGKLVERRSKRHTKAGAGNWAASAGVTECFHYGPVGAAGAACSVEGGGFAGLNGRLDRLQTTITPWSAGQLTMEFCQDSLGEESALVYPNLATKARTEANLKFTYSNGFLTAVNDQHRLLSVISSVEYAPNGVPTRIQRGSSILDLEQA